MSDKRKLIEALKAINRVSAREKSIRHGHPSVLHPRGRTRPLVAWRAMTFASLVDDPCDHPDESPTDQAQESERRPRFRIIYELVKWDDTTKEQVLEAACAKTLRSCGGPPPIYDPFCGGGSTGNRLATPDDAGTAREPNPARSTAPRARGRRE